MTAPSSCGNCGLPFPPDLAGTSPQLCAGCGKRTFSVVCVAENKATPHVSALHHDDFREKGFLESERPSGVSAFASLDGSTIKFGATGPGSFGEHDTVTICQRLVSALNARGCNWGAVLPGTGETDCIAKDPVTGDVLQMQVVRAIVDQQFWRQLSQTGAVTHAAPCADAADLLLAAIQKKEDPIPLPQRADLVLVLDANRAPGVAFEDVIATFRNRHGQTAANLGFAAIYVVGPDDALVKSLA